MLSNIFWGMVYTHAIILSLAIFVLAIRLTMLPFESRIDSTWLQAIAAYFTLSIIAVLGWMALRYSLNIYWRR